MRTPVAIYPLSKNIIPIIKHFEKFQDNYCIGRVVAPLGSGLCGEDINFALNHKDLGIEVYENFDYASNEWEVMLIHNNQNENIFTEENIEKIIVDTINNNKRVIFYDIPSEPLKNCIGRLGEIYDTRVQYVSMNTKTKHRRIVGKSNDIIEVPVILVGGIVDNEDIFDIVLQLANELKTNNYSPAIIARGALSKVFGTYDIMHILENKEYNECTKIEEIVEYIKDIEDEIHPDVVIIECPSSVMKFNDIAPNGYGILTYLLCQAVTPSYCICDIPYELFNPSFCSVISNDLMYRLNTPIDAFSISNVIVDSQALVSTKKVTILRVNDELVNRQMSQAANFETPVCNAIYGGVNKVYDDIKDKVLV